MTHHCWRHCFFHYSSLKKTASEVTDVDTQAVLRLATKQVRSSIFFFGGIAALKMRRIVPHCNN